MSAYQTESLLLIDSRHRQSGADSSDFTISVPSVWETKQNIRSVEVHSFTFTNSVYNVKKDTLFQINQSGSTKSILVPAGFYSFNQLNSFLTTTVSSPAVGWTLAVDSVTRKCTINAATGSNSNTTAWQFVTADVFTHMLGFSDQALSSNSNFPNATIVQTGTKVVNVYVDQFMYIAMKSMQGNLSLATMSGSSKGANLQRVILTIPLTSSWGSLQHFLPPNHEFQLPAAQNIQTLEFKLLDYNGDAINLNGTEWSMRLHVNFGN
jgi:hypothetical protein